MKASAARFFHLSNLLTYISLAAGLLAIFAAPRLGGLSIPGGLIALCCLVDTLDGRFARLFPRTKDREAFGLQLDSLTDAVAFGVVPVVACYFVAPLASWTAHVAWFTAAFFYLLSAITRLGVYNIQGDARSGFVGLPTTVAGLVWSSFFLASPSGTSSIVVSLACGIAMVSPIRIPRPKGPGTAAIILWATLLMALHGARVMAGS
jgi:CDP-diacylglycerol--serine O-phosphatidyltransferase